MNNKTLRIALFTILLIVLFPTLSFAKGSLPNHTGSFYVNDFANVIDDKTENYMVNYGIQLHKKNGAQVVVVTVDFTGGTPIKEYATSLFNSWGVGSAEKNNGLLLLLSIKDDDYWAVQGKGIETSLTNDKISRILSQDLEPDFAVKDYNSGVRKTYGAFIQSLGGTWTETLKTKNYVSDNAGVFKQVTKDYLNQSGTRYQATTGTGIYVVTVRNSGDMTLQDYTKMKFNSVGAGPRDVMLVMDIGGDNYHVLQGKDVDRILTNEAIGNILGTVLEPLFVQKNYAGGATATASAFYSFFLARAEHPQGAAVNSQGTAAPAQAGSSSNSSNTGKIIAGFLIFIGIIAAFGIASSRRNKHLSLYGVPYNPYSRRSVRRYGTWQGQRGNGYGGGRWNNRHHHHEQTLSSGQSSFWGNSGGGGSTNGGGAGRFYSSGSSGDENEGGGGSSSGGGAGRRSSSSWEDDDSGSSSGGSSYSGGGGSSGGDGSASSGGGAGRH